MSASRLDAPVEESEATLDRYRSSLRKQRLVYFPVVGAILVVLVVVVAVAWSRGEVANTTLHTEADPPAAVAVGAPAATATLAWSTKDRAATGDPRFNGTVIVYGTHAVRGVDATTGRTTWSYTRSNRTVCAALQTSGITVAVYRVGGNCDEVTALNSGSGARLWTRTLDQDGQPVNGTPSFQALPYTMLVTTPSVVYAIDPGSGYNRWTYARYGCAISRAVVGTSGVLISQTCTHPDCKGLKFCGTGPQLLLRDGNAAVDDKSKNPSNYDHVIWNLRGNTDVPVSADSVVSALDTSTRALALLDGATGKAAGSVSLSPAPSAAGPIASFDAGGAQLVTVRGVAAAVVGSGRPAWSRAVTGPLSAVPARDGRPLDLTDGRITVPSTGGAAVLDGDTGRVTRQVTLTPAPAPGSSIYPLGSGQLVYGAGGTAAYR